MAAVTHRVSTASTTNAEAYASALFTPGANELLIAMVMATATAALGTMTDSQGLGFTLVTSVARNANTLYIFVANALAAASAMTVTFDCTGDAATGAVIQVAGISGMTNVGATAIRQSKTAHAAAATTPAVTFDVAALTDNPTIAACMNNANPAGLTPPTDWTERDDTGFNNPSAGAEYATRDSGFTGTTITWGAASASQHGEIIVELDASAPAGGSILPQMMHLLN